MRDADTAERIAERFHEAYERLASQYGYSTRKESSVPWPEVPEANRMLMVAVVNELGLLRLVEAAEHTAELEATVEQTADHVRRLQKANAELQAHRKNDGALRDEFYGYWQAAEAERDAALAALLAVDDEIQMHAGSLDPESWVSHVGDIVRAALAGPATKEQP